VFLHLARNCGPAEQSAVTIIKEAAAACQRQLGGVVLLLSTFAAPTPCD
jgi:hypothetical protein